MPLSTIVPTRASSRRGEEQLNPTLSMILVIEVAPQIELSWTVDCQNSGSSQKSTLELPLTSPFSHQIV